MPPCLTRENCLSGRALIERLNLAPAIYYEAPDAYSDTQQSSTCTPLASPSISSSSIFGPGVYLDDAVQAGITGLRRRHFTGPAGNMNLNMAESSLQLRRVQANMHPLPQGLSDELSAFERLITGYEPILENLLAFLPTSSIFQLYHTSQYLRRYLAKYPLAWKTLSFRLPQPGNNIISPGGNTGESADFETKQYALDLVLKRVVVPIASRLTSLDLCNTSISGALLVGSVLEPRKETLQHISVRGCKNVSLKYHIVPYLHQMKIETRVWGDTRAFALRSLYTYRCRHHRRRPYLPASLIRRDSDSEPTHDLIELCHALGIWTDTAWCPTPGPRCHRRKDYHGTRAAPGTMEVWVPFDRLWRSSNRIGPADEHSHRRPRVGKLWEEVECGHDGEGLGSSSSDVFAGEGKHMPTHLRQSHRAFVETVKCDQCEQIILERCETCSIRMHCMGCRKTLCASCAFNRPLQKRARARDSHSSGGENSQASSDVAGSSAPEKEPVQLWWAPDAIRSPNIMTDAADDPESDEEPRTPARVNGQQQPLQQNQQQQPQQQQAGPLKIKMYWCCLEPLFSGGGGVAFVGPGLGGHGSERIRAVPLQKQRQYMDPDFCHDLNGLPDSNFQKFEDRVSNDVDIMPYLQQTNLDLQAKTCPRCLCQSCYSSFKWKIECRACKKAICREHDFRALKIRKCGYRDLTDEREYVRNPPQHTREEHYDDAQWPRELVIPQFSVSKPVDSPNPELSVEDDRRARQFDTASQEWSDAGSLGEGPITRDPSSTPRATPSPFADRSSSATRGLHVDDDEGQPSVYYQNLDLIERAKIVARSRPFLRGRSHSMSDAYDGKGKGKVRAILAQNSMMTRERRLLPCSPNHPVQWAGCGSYYCQGSRSMGDTRQRCYATGRECSECGVFVCQFCMPKSGHGKCTCSFCENNYHCPHCFEKDAIRRQCLREEEIRAREAAAAQERLDKESRARTEQEQAEQEHADLILKWGGEFWGALVNGNGADPSALADMPSSSSAPPPPPSTPLYEDTPQLESAAATFTTDLNAPADPGPSASDLAAVAAAHGADAANRMMNVLRIDEYYAQRRHEALAALLHNVQQPPPIVSDTARPQEHGARQDEAGAAETTAGEEDPEMLAAAA